MCLFGTPRDTVKPAISLLGFGVCEESRCLWEYPVMAPWHIGVDIKLYSKAIYYICIPSIFKWMWLNFDVVTARPDGCEDWDASRNESTNTSLVLWNSADMFLLRAWRRCLKKKEMRFNRWLTAFDRWLIIALIGCAPSEYGSQQSSLSSFLFCLHTPGYTKYDRSTASSQVCVHDFHIFHLFKTC